MRGPAVAAGLLLTTAAPALLSAQRWNEPRVLELVRLATDRRAQQLADSGLTDYKATAHGYLTFLAQIGEGFREPPKVVKADELALEVYWGAPNRSKQRIIGRRDTTLVPTDIEYHRDHLGIVQNNFPAIIRLGDGDEVKDVPHPLSRGGRDLYDFAISDSLRISFPGRAISVLEVKVRPRDEREARVIGALYLDRDNGQVVRMALSFTRAAFKDPLLEDLFVVLENGLVGTRFWLPRRQEVEIRRTATWMEYPVRGIIRGRWEIAEYELNVGLERELFEGAEIVQAPPATQRAHQWPSRRILDSLPPDVRAITAEEIRRVQAEVRTLVRGQALRRAQGLAIAGRGVSDFARFNRVEGLALGSGAAWRVGGGVTLLGQARYGFDDERAKGIVQIAWQDAQGRSLRLFASDDHRDAGEVAERSGFVNSIASQEFGSDYTQPYRVRAAGVDARVSWAGFSWSLRGAREEHEALAVNARPATGRFHPTLPVPSLGGWRVLLEASRPTQLWIAGTEMRSTLRAGTLLQDSGAVWRGVADIELQRPISQMRMVSRTLIAGALSGIGIPPQEMVYFGGPVTSPGYRFHSLADDAAASQRIELQFPVPFPAVSLGRFGRSAGTATLAPFVTATGLRRSGVYPSVGIAALMLFDLVRVEVARGLRNQPGPRTLWSIDIAPAFWGIM